MDTKIRSVSHYGLLHFGDLQCEAVVLEGGERGYVRREFARMLGFHEGHKGSRFAKILEDYVPNSLSELDNSREPILLPSGRKAQFFPAGIIADLAAAIVHSALAGSLHKARKGSVPNCMKILHALATTGEIALIDEATGYQFHRAPDALQKWIARLLRSTSGSWERRFPADYYQAMYGLFGWKYAGHTQNPPSVIGQITQRWVYCQVLPDELIHEIRSRKRISHKYHQWLTENGLMRLEQQIHSVTAIARCSASYRDFDRRCRAAFAGGWMQLGLLPEELNGGR